MDAEHSFDRSGDRLGGGEFAAEFRSREVAGIHAGEHSGAGPQVDTRFPRRGGDAQHQRLFVPVGPDSGKSGEVETLSAGVEPRIDFQKNFFHTGNGDGKQKNEEKQKGGFFVYNSSHFCAFP